jgi:hypothetical protein
MTFFRAEWDVIDKGEIFTTLSKREVATWSQTQAAHLFPERLARKDWSAFWLKGLRPMFL